MKKWRCTVCGYIHEGESPPDVCPVCGVGPEFFELLKEEEGEKTKEPADNITPKNQPGKLDLTGGNNPEEMKKALFTISYGLYIVTSANAGVVNGQAANTVFQVTGDPLRIALGINKSNLTHELIEKSNTVGITVLGQDGHELVRRFGYRSGREKDKFAGIEFSTGVTGAPIVAGGIAYLEGKIFDSMDMGTHTLYAADVVAGKVLRADQPMTYAYFRATK